MSLRGANPRLSPSANLKKGGFMSKEEFLKQWWILLDADCKKSVPTSTSRSFTDNEAERLGVHLWEWFEQIRMYVPIETLAIAMLKTQRAYQGGSMQDWAEAILRYITSKPI